MLQAHQFWQYAEEAMRSARHAKTDKDKRALLDLARTWSQAALRSESTVVAIVVHDSPTEVRAL
jgi:hypothetical protein